MKNSDTRLTSDEVRRQLAYDPATGVFTWLSTGRRGVRSGRRAGNVEASNGHRYIRLHGKSYQASRLAWLYVHGEWPSRKLRFLDGDRDNCAVGNLSLPEWDFSTKEGRNAYERSARQRRFEVFRASDLRKDFGISLDVYQHFFVAQKGVCAICERPERETRGGKVKWLAVDHCHETNVVRGLLCTACNTALGKFGDDPDRLRAAAAYLERSRLSDDKDGNVIRFAKRGLA